MSGTEYQQQNTLSTDTADIPIAGAGSSAAAAPVSGASYYAWTWEQILATVLDLGIPDRTEVTGQSWTVIQNGGQASPGLHLIWKAQWDTSPKAGATSIQVYLSPAVYSAGGAWDRFLNVPPQALSGVQAGSYGTMPLNPVSFQAASLAVASATKFTATAADQFRAMIHETTAPSSGFKGSAADVLAELLGDLRALMASLHGQMTSPVDYSTTIATTGDSAAKFLSDTWAAYNNWIQQPEHSPLGAIVQVLENIAVPGGNGGYEIPNPQQTPYGDLTTDAAWQQVEQQAKTVWTGSLLGASSDFSGLDVLGRIALGKLVDQYASSTQEIVPVIGPGQPRPAVPGPDYEPGNGSSVGKGTVAPGPGTSGPAVAEPGVAAPGAAGPGVAAPAVAGPGVAAPAVAGPGVAAPAVAAPGLAGTAALRANMAGGDTAVPGPGSSTGDVSPVLDAVGVSPVITSSSQVPTVSLLAAQPGLGTGTADAGQPADGIPAAGAPGAGIGAGAALGVLGSPDASAEASGALAAGGGTADAVGQVGDLAVAGEFAGTIGRGGRSGSARGHGKGRDGGHKRRAAPVAGFSLGRRANGSVLEQSAVPVTDPGPRPGGMSSALNVQLVPGGPAAGTAPSHELAGAGPVSHLQGAGQAIPGSALGLQESAGAGVGQPMLMPGCGPGGLGQAQQERERLAYLPEEEEYWGTDPGYADASVGRGDRDEPEDSEYDGGPAVAVGIGADSRLGAREFTAPEGRT